MAASRSRSRSSSSGRSSSSRGGSSSRGRSSRGGGGSSRGGAAKTTQDHEQIRQWAESRGGKPACVAGTESKNSCLLRIDMPGGAGADKLQELEWDEFFDRFDRNGLVFLYQDKTKGGGTSRFNKFVTPETAAAKGSSRSRGRDAR
jgi:hypothetical protein